MADTSQPLSEPHTNGVVDGLTEEEKSKIRPADIDAVSFVSNTVPVSNKKNRGKLNIRDLLSGLLSRCEDLKIKYYATRDRNKISFFFRRT